MSEALKTMFLMMLFGFILMLQYNIDADRTSTRQLKNTLELALHDASLSLDETQLSRGKIVFDQGKADEKLKESLSYHLGLTKGLIPVKNSFYQHPFQIKSIEYIDEKKNKFPMDYKNPKYNIVNRLNGPAIIAVIETKSPRYFRGEGITITQAAVYEYKP
ncbi:peptidase M23 [Bacillus cereus]|nr:peptidase M23 [Bacillus cereus]MEC3260901.1 peptidase M23 [Bacillus cereus]